MGLHHHHPEGRYHLIMKVVVLLLALSLSASAAKPELAVYYECPGNVVQACTVHYITDMALQVSLMNCMSAANRPEQAGPECFQQFQLVFEAVQACIDGPEGLALHVKNGEEHNSLIPSAWGVPWPVWDGEGGDAIIIETDRLGVIGYLCEYFYNNELDVCTK